jgi:flagella basal body P-ring formation protein FlgA
MIRKIIIASVAFLALAASAAAQDIAALERPRLKADAVVTGDLVRIGDLVEHAGVVADVPIFRSPDLGTTGSVSAQAVVEAVRHHALVGLDTGGIQDVEVTRASRTIAAQDIEDCLTRALAAKLSLGTPDDVSLTLDSDLRALHVEPDARGEPQVSRLDYDTRSGRFNATLQVPTGRATRRPLRLFGRATVTVEVATVARTVTRGAILKDADITLERLPRARVGRGVITDRAEAIGLAARNILRPGQPLRTAQLMKPELIRRNQQVTLVYQMPGIMLTVRGKATESGAEGDVIAVLNEQSKRVLRGVIVGPGRVALNPPARSMTERVAAASAAPGGGAR